MKFLKFLLSSFAIIVLYDSFSMKKKKKKEKKFIKINGMTCMGCVKSTQKALLKTDGVTKAEVDLKIGVAYVEYDKSKTKLKDLEKAVSDAGFVANPKKQLKNKEKSDKKTPAKKSG